MTPQELTDLLTENISLGLRHANYDRCLAVRKFAKMITTGEGQDDEVTRYRRFEDDDLKDQRVRLYNSLTKYALARPRKYWKRMHRIEGIRRTFQVDKSAEKTLAEIQNQIYNFMPGEALEQWLNRVLEYYGVTDPNAWIFYERNDRKNIEGTPIKTSVYPVIFSCENVLNYKKSFGVLEWIVVRNTRIERVVKGAAAQDEVMEDFYLYAPGFIVRMREASEKSVAEQGEAEINVPMYWGVQTTVDPTGKSGNAPTQQPSQKTRRFFQKVITNGTKEVPAECVGVYFDEVADQGSFVPWFDPAENVFNDLIHEKSIADTLLTVYAFPKTTEYTKPCRFRHPEMGECVHGYYNDIHDREHTCTSCNGTGEMSGFTTEQAKIKLIMPDGATSADLIELSKLSHTQDIDITYLQWLDSKIDRTEARIMAAVFDTGLVQKPTNTAEKTAAEINALMEGIADVLAPFGGTFSKHFELVFRVAGQYRGISIDVDHSFPETLQIELLPDAVSSFDAIKNAGVGYEAIVAKRKLIFQKLFEGNPEIQKTIEARYIHKPWDDKTDEQLAQILTGLSGTDPLKVQWTYWREIFLEIESADPLFSQKSYKMQLEIVATKVEEFIKRIQVEQIDPQTIPPNFNDPAAQIDNNPALNANAQ
jgi:hypothetical protein